MTFTEKRSAYHMNGHLKSYLCT